MNTMSSVRRASVCAMCIALCYVLPLAFHALAAGSMLSPMHIPVLLCGIICGPGYGVFCGIAGPVLSSVLSGMPSATGLIAMVPELLTYGLVCGLLMKRIHTKKLMLDIFISMIPAMILGRLVGGAADALFYLGTTGEYSVSIFISSYLVGSLPGIAMQLILVPTLTLTLEKARAIPARYPKTKQE